MRQVYASYKYRRDLAKAAQVPGILSRSRQLSSAEAHELVSPPPALSLEASHQSAA